MEEKKKILLIYIFWILFHQLHSQSNSAPELSANESQFYCPRSEQPIVTNFTIQNNGEDSAKAIYIQISSGYDRNRDQLIFKGDANKINSSWSINEAKLTLTGIGGVDIPYLDLVEAVKSVSFYSSSPNPNIDKSISISLGNANYLPSNGHYYQFISDLNITWTEAKTAAENKNYYGIKGYLVTITSSDESQLAGELSAGAGWIGGTDEEEEGVWKWASGPEKGTVFWNGNINGSTPNFAYWNNNEPNNCCQGEDYAHITDNSIGISGSWNDLPNQTQSSGAYQAKGYLVEYGGMPGDPILKISTSTKLIMPRIQKIENIVACEGDLVNMEVDTNVNDVRWFDTKTDGNLINTGISYDTKLVSSTTFWLDIYPEDCAQSERIPVTATIYPYPIILTPMLSIEQCDQDNSNDGITIFNLTEFESSLSKYYENEIFEYYTDKNFSLSSKINNPTNYQNIAFEQKIYVKINTPSNCYDYTSILLKVSASEIEDDIFANHETCESVIKSWGNGLEKWDKSIFDNLDRSIINSDVKFQNQRIKITYYKSEDEAFTAQNKVSFDLENKYLMRTPYLENIWARIDNLNLNQISCLGVKKVASLRVNPLPEFERADDTKIVCLNLDPIPVGVRSTDERNYSYTWKLNGKPFPKNIPEETSTILISEGGDYRVSATTIDGTLCSRSAEFKITPSQIASITQSELVVVDLVGDTGTIEVLTQNLGLGDYEFSLNDQFGPYQDSPYFDQVYPGISKLFIRDKNSCGIAEIEVSLLGHMNYFSPNGDGLNDYWHILGVNENFQPKSRIYIYNRFGQLLLYIKPSQQGWDGTFNGSQLPQDDYWFRVFFEDGREHSGHFSLLRNL